MTSLTSAPDDTPIELWDHQANEPPKAYAAFRVYRDLPPIQRSHLRVANQIQMSERRIRGWAAQWDWLERVNAWDDACHRLEDQERLEAIREMHSVHRRAGREIIEKALLALGSLDSADIPPNTIARLIEIGARLERQTLIVSVEELQGIETVEEIDDPWEKIARELDPANTNNPD